MASPQFMLISLSRSLLPILCFTCLFPLLPLHPAQASQLVAQATDFAAGDREQEIAEQFIDLVFSQRYSEALQYIHPVLQAELSPERLQQGAEQFQKRSGMFIKRLDTRVDGDVVLVNTQFERVTDTILIIFDDSGSITGVDFPQNSLQSAQ